jgi:hypothetical protein
MDATWMCESSMSYRKRNTKLDSDGVEIDCPGSELEG